MAVLTDQQRPLFAMVPLDRNCTSCGKPLRQGEGGQDQLCLGCRNVERADRDYVLDLLELDFEFNPGEPIGMWRWHSLIRGEDASDREDNVRRAWERFKAWCRDHDVPAEAEPDDTGTGRKPLVLKRGIRQWLIEAEARWLAPEPKAPWEAADHEQEEA